MAVVVLEGTPAAIAMSSGVASAAARRDARRLGRRDRKVHPGGHVGVAEGRDRHGAHRRLGSLRVSHDSKLQEAGRAPVDHERLEATNPANLQA